MAFELQKAFNHQHDAKTTRQKRQTFKKRNAWPGSLFHPLRHWNSVTWTSLDLDTLPRAKWGFTRGFSNFSPKIWVNWDVLTCFFAKRSWKKKQKPWKPARKPSLGLQTEGLPEAGCSTSLEKVKTKNGPRNKKRKYFFCFFWTYVLKKTLKPQKIDKEPPLPPHPQAHFGGVPCKQTQSQTLLKYLCKKTKNFI